MNRLSTSELFSQPIFSRQDTSTHFTFHVRHIPYPSETYSITVDQNTQQIVVATSNKKYFKRIDIPEMAALRKAAKPPTQSTKQSNDDKMQIDSHQDGMLDESSIVWNWNNSTLTIQYPKPDAILALETKYKAVLQRAA